MRPRAEKCGKMRSCYWIVLELHIQIYGSWYFEQEFLTHTGYWSGLWNWPIPQNGTPEENKNRKSKFTLDCVVEWAEKYKNIDGCFCLFEAYALFSPLY